MIHYYQRSRQRWSNCHYDKNYHYEMVMEHLQDESTYLEADLENPDKRLMEIIKEFADEYTPEVLTEKEKEIYV